MHTNDIVPLVLAHVEDHPLAQNPRDVDENVELAPGVERETDEILRLAVVGDVRVVGDGIAAPLFDEPHDLIGRLTAQAFSRHGRSVVRDDHRGALIGQQQGDATPDTTSSTGDDGGLTFQMLHVQSPLSSPMSIQAQVEIGGSRRRAQ